MLPYVVQREAWSNVCGFVNATLDISSYILDMQTRSDEILKAGLKPMLEFSAGGYRGRRSAGVDPHSCISAHRQMTHLQTYLFIYLQNQDSRHYFLLPCLPEVLCFLQC